MNRAEILENARKCVCGERENKYGSPENNFQAIADLWATYLQHKSGVGLDAVDVANMMVLFKVGRACTGTGSADTYVDIAGYAACAGEVGGAV